MSKMEEGSFSTERETEEVETCKDQEPLPKHWVVAVMPRAFAVLFMVLLFVWIYRAEGGLGFVESNLFGFHALLMSLFVVVFMQEALLAWSVPVFNSKSHKKAYHVFCHIAGLICAVLGLVAIVKYKRLASTPTVFPFFTCYSPHSWMAIVFLSLWGIQIMSKLGLTIPLAYHRFLGNCIFAVGLAVCAMGLQDMQSSDLATSTPPMENMAGMQMNGYYPDSLQARLASAGSIVLVFLGITTFFTQVSA